MVLDSNRAMADFSDEQDRALIQLVLQNLSPITQSIDWNAVTEQFPRVPRTPAKTKLALRNRLSTLKRTYGKDISRFPPRLLGQHNATRAQPPVVHQPNPTSTVTVQSFQQLLDAPLIPGREYQIASHVLPARNQDTHTASLCLLELANQPVAAPAVARSAYEVLGTSTTVPAATPVTTNQDIQAACVSTQASVTGSTTNEDIQAPSTGAHRASTNLVDMDPDCWPPPRVRLVRRTKPFLKSTKTDPAPPAVAPPAVVNALSEEDTYAAIDRIFESITREDISQPHRTPSHNAGEILPVGVMKMIEAMNVKPTDIFGDIGSGAGNILAQIALQTQVQRCIGLEIREELADRSIATLRSFYQAFPQLSRVVIYSGDITNLTPQARTELETCTILYCNNYVFAPRDSQAVQDFILTSRNARMVLSTGRFCARCRGARCPSAYCQVWIEQGVVKTSASWTAAPVDVFIYGPRNTNAASSMLDVVESVPDEDNTPFTSSIRII
jgi:hypothetical protein